MNEVKPPKDRQQKLELLQALEWLKIVRPKVSIQKAAKMAIPSEIERWLSRPKVAVARALAK